MYVTGRDVRLACREGRLTSQTSGLAKGYVQANLAILPKDWAYDFLIFAQRNPKPCPILEVGEVGSVKSFILSKDGDVCTDFPKYRVFKDGELVDEPTDISDLWQDDFVYFLIGCSFSFEEALLSADLDVRHITEGKNVPMYRSNLICQGAGRFKDTQMVVSMRPFSPSDAMKAIAITRDFPSVHGGPVHIGDPSQIGIQDINSPDWGDSVKINEGEVPLFWACGVTPQQAAAVAKPPIMITHAPGHMFVGDKKNYDYRI
ncbi:MAG: putative hydro-lyase [Spirochaetales bacterium]|nr:putative hydro-lyase [Spirochaetales bacterium]